MGESREIRIGVKAGCFTLFHAGHVAALEYCAERCDYLIVLTNDDNKIMKKKGCVPLTLDQRLKILRAMRYVNEAHGFKEDIEEFWVQRFMKNRMKQQFGVNSELIMFHDPHVPEPIPCKSIANSIVFVPYFPIGQKYSVTDMFNIIREGA